MDTLNVRKIDTSSTTIGTSETHSEKATSDEEDFKLDIPFYNNEGFNNGGGSGGGGGCGVGIEINYTKPQQRNQHQHQQPNNQQSPTSSNYDMMQQNTNNDDNDNNANQLNYTNWDNDDLISSDYSGQSTSESPNIFQTPCPPCPSNLYYDDPNAPDIKYTPNELLMQPPNRYNNLMDYEMQQPTQQQQQQQRRHLQPLPTPPHLQHMHPALQYRHHQQNLHHPQYGGPFSHQHHHHHHHHHQQQQPQQQQHQHQMPHHMPQHQQPPPQHASTGFHHHPNMWYPNAPYGSSRYNYDSQRYPYHYNAGYGHDPMMDMLQLSNSGREARNRAEKNRRDKLNGSIQELSTMVPHVAESPRRVDKTAVLRFAAHGLRLKYVFGDSMHPQRLQAAEPLMKLLDSFFITLTCHGQIVLISSSIEQHLGHCQADLYGQNILHITHPEDHSMLKQQLIPTDLENLFHTNDGDDDGTEPHTRTQEEEELIEKKLREDKRSFTVRLARAGPRSEPTSYEVVRIDGCFRRSDAAPRGVKNNTFSSSLQLIRRSRGRDDSIPLHTISGNDIVLIAMARIIRPPKVINRVIDMNTLEYKTRHLIDGRIIDCDQRIGLVAGYMTNEVRNLSPFTFMHQDDARWVIVALRQMYDCNSSYGESAYRLLSRNGNFIYLQSRGYLEIDKDTNKVHSFICINTLLDEEEGKRRIQEMKRKFSIIINTQIPQSSIDAPASENPQQLEKAVLRLIQNLQKSSDDEENYEHNGEHNTVNSRSSSSSHKITTHHSTESNKSLNSGTSTSKTPPLALVPPETASVKSSISKSVSLVNVTAGRSLHQRLKSPISTTEDDDDDDEDELVGGEHKYHLQTSPTILLPKCTCRSSNFNGGSQICDYCRRFNYTQQFQVNRAAQKHKLSGSHSSDGDDEAPQKRKLQETTSENLSSPAQIDSPTNPIGRDFSEQREQYDYSDQSSIETMEEQQIPADIFVNFQNDFEIEIDSRQNNDKCTTKTTTTITTNQNRLKDTNVNQR